MFLLFFRLLARRKKNHITTYNKWKWKLFIFDTKSKKKRKQTRKVEADGHHLQTSSFVPIKITFLARKQQNFSLVFIIAFFRSTNVGQKIKEGMEFFCENVYRHPVRSPEELLISHNHAQLNKMVERLNEMLFWRQSLWMTSEEVGLVTSASDVDRKIS